MLPETVIDRQVARPPTIAFHRVLERHPVGLFPAEGLDEQFVSAVGPRRVGPGADVSEAQDLARLGKAARDVGGAVD